MWAKRNHLTKRNSLSNIFSPSAISFTKLPNILRLFLLVVKAKLEKRSNGKREVLQAEREDVLEREGGGYMKMGGSAELEIGKLYRDQRRETKRLEIKPLGCEL